MEFVRRRWLRKKVAIFGKMKEQSPGILDGSADNEMCKGKVYKLS
jgi:hypothetical protein